MKPLKKLQDKSPDLGFVVQCNFMKSALLPIIMVQLVLLGLYLISHHYIIEKTLNLLRVNALDTISEISLTEAKNIDDQLREISRNSRSLQVEHQALFTHSLKRKLAFLEPPTETEFSASHRFGNSSVFVSSKTGSSQEVSEKIVRTEKMETRLETLVNSNPNIVSSSFVSWDNVVRIYPFIEDFYDQFPRDFDLTKRNLYYLADAEHNPERESVWTNAYPATDGKGWELSNLTPVYRNNFLEGVNALTVTLNTFAKYFRSKDLQWDSGSLLLDKHGNTLTMSNAAEQYLGVSSLSNSSLKNTSEEKPTSKHKTFNLLKQNTEVGMLFSRFFNDSKKSMELTLNGKDYLLTKQGIPETGWQLFLLTPLSVVYEPILAEETKIERLCLLFLFIAAIFYALFFIRIKRSSQRLAKRITTPINKIIHMIEVNAVDDETHKIHEPVNIAELDKLLSMNLKIQKAKVRYHNISKKMSLKNKQLKTLAITDQLTQLYNRLKLDGILSYEVARSHRDKTPLAVAIIDIDKFKLVNDTFGHQVGDSVLTDVAQIMLKNIRSTDIVGRWGGEEFMLILPNTSLENASKHANKLRKLIEGSSFVPVKKVTISVGIASCREVGCKKMLVELADNALYEAKNNGRNRVELAPIAKTEPERELSALSC